MKILLPITFTALMILSVSCKTSEHRSHRSEAANDDRRAVLAVSAGIHDSDVKAADKKEQEESPAKTEHKTVPVKKPGCST